MAHKATRQHASLQDTRVDTDRPARHMATGIPPITVVTSTIAVAVLTVVRVSTHTGVRALRQRYALPNHEQAPVSTIGTDRVCVSAHDTDLVPNDVSAHTVGV